MAGVVKTRNGLDTENNVIKTETNKNANTAERIGNFNENQNASFLTKLDDLIDVLTSTATDKALTAAQGKVLKDITDAVVAQQAAISLILESNNINLDNFQEIVDAIETLQTSASLLAGKQVDTTGRSTGKIVEFDETLFSGAGGYKHVEKPTGTGSTPPTWQPKTFGTISLAAGELAQSAFYIPATGNFAISAITSSLATGEAQSIVLKVQLSNITSLDLTLPANVTEDGLAITDNVKEITGTEDSWQLVVFERNHLGNWDIYLKGETTSTGGGGGSSGDAFATPTSIVGSTYTFNVASEYDKKKFKYTEAGAATWVISNLPDGGTVQIDVILASASHVVTLPANFFEDGEAAPTITVTGASGDRKKIFVQRDGSNYEIIRENGEASISPTTGRTASTEILCDNLYGVFYNNLAQTGAVVFSLAATGQVVGSTARLLFTSDGVNTIAVNSDFDFVYGIESDGSTVLPEGQYEIFVLYNPNGKASFSVPGGESTETSSNTDVVSPSFQNSTPSISSIAPTSFSIDVQLDEVGTLYYVLVANNATAPSVEQVEDGQDSTGAAALKSGSIVASSPGAPYSGSVTALTASTNYDVYCFAVDLFGNRQAAVTKLDVSTSAVADSTPPAFISGYPVVANLQSTSFDVQVQLDEPGAYYYVLVADGAAMPTSAQVKLGQDSTGAAALKSGSQTVVAATTTYTSSITGLTNNIAYDLYVVAQDVSVNLQASPTKIDVTTNNILLLTDDFAGTTINTSLHTVNDPADNITISQNDGLIFTGTTPALSDLTKNFVQGISTINNSNLTMAFDVTRTGSDAALTSSIIGRLAIDANNHITITRAQTTAFAQARLIVVTNGNTRFDQAPGDILSGKRWKIVKGGNIIRFYYWNGSSWTKVGSNDVDVTATPFIGTDFKHFFWIGSHASDDVSATFGRLRITNNDYTTELP